MEHIGLYAHGVTDIHLNHPEIMVIPALERSVILNQNEIRVFNEQYTQSLKGGQMMLNEERLYAIFDSPLWQGTTFQGIGYNSDPPLVNSAEFEETGVVFSQNDLRDLALTLGMDGTTMTTTLSVYNEGILSNSDPLGKDVPNLTAIQTPPFYAKPKLQLSTGKSFGGAQTDSLGQTTIQNLYTVGESAGFLGSTASGWGFSGSITMPVTIWVNKLVRKSLNTTHDDIFHPIYVLQRGL